MLSGAIPLSALKYVGSMSEGEPLANSDASAVNGLEGGVIMEICENRDGFEGGVIMAICENRDGVEVEPRAIVESEHRLSYSNTV